MATVTGHCTAQRNCYGFVSGLAISVFIILGIAIPSRGNAETLPAARDTIHVFSELRKDEDGDSESDYLGRPVTVYGVANFASGLLHEQYLQIFIQNDSGGLPLFSIDIDTPVNQGDSVIAHGKVDEYYGLTEVHVDSYRVVPNNSPFPYEPVTLAEVAVNPKPYEGMLVQGSGRITEMGTRFNGKYFKITPEDAAQNAEPIMVYVTNFHSRYRDFDFDVLSTGDYVEVKGVLSLYDPENDGNSVYKIFLRTPEDLKYAGLPNYYLKLGIGGILILTALVLGWVLLLRSQVGRQTSDMKTSLREKEMMLKEIHHRVKNNMAIISGLLELQIDSTESAAARKALKNSQARIKSMAMVHEKLYNSDDIEEINMRIYIRELVEGIAQTYEEVDNKVDLRFDLDEMTMGIDKVVPYGLLINEMVTNAYKYAFNEDRKGILTVMFKQTGPEVILRIADNGPGLPEGSLQPKDGSLGLILIHTFVNELEGTLEVNAENGTSFTVRCKV